MLYPETEGYMILSMLFLMYTIVLRSLGSIIFETATKFDALPFGTIFV